MNAYKTSLSNTKLGWSTMLIKISFLAIFAITSISGQAQPCFDDAQSAYNYLINRENLETQATTQAAVNINRADEGELTSLQGIGSSKAQAIILYREMFGDFKTVDELAKVKGIGAKTIENNRSRLSVQN